MQGKSQCVPWDCFNKLAAALEVRTVRLGCYSEDEEIIILELKSFIILLHKRSKYTEFFISFKKAQEHIYRAPVSPKSTIVLELSPRKEVSVLAINTEPLVEMLDRFYQKILHFSMEKLLNS